MMAAVRNAGEALAEGREAFKKGMTYEGMLMEGRPLKPVSKGSNLTRTESRRAYEEALEAMRRIAAGGHGFSTVDIMTVGEDE